MIGKIALLPPDGILELRKFCLLQAVEFYVGGERFAAKDEEVVSTAEAYEMFILRDYKGE
jgi:hypothetical protein